MLAVSIDNNLEPTFEWLREHPLNVTETQTAKLCVRAPSILTYICGRKHQTEIGVAGAIPRALLRLPSLRILDLHYNKLDGSLPADMPHSSSLSFLALHDNALTGSIPLSMLEHLDLSSNRFEGSIPSSIAELTGLKYLVLANNRHLNSGSSFQQTNRTGALPNWLGDLDKLVVLDLGENHFDGQVPQHLSKLQGLELLFLHRNKLILERCRLNCRT